MSYETNLNRPVALTRPQISKPSGSSEFSEKSARGFSGRHATMLLFEKVQRGFLESKDHAVAQALQSYVTQLQKNTSSTLREGFLSLTPLHRKVLIARFGEDRFHQLFSIAQDSQRIFEERLFNFGRDVLKKEELAPLASGILQGLSDASAPLGFKVSSAIQKAALEQWQAVIGVGSGLRRLEFSTQKLATDFANPGLFGGMFVGTAFFNVGKNVIRAGLAARSANLFTRGVGASIISSTGALPGEVLAFYGVNKGYHHLTVPLTPASAATIPQELGALGMTLSLLKIGGAGSSALFSLVHGSLKNGTAPLITRWSQRLFPQTGMFGAISLGNYLEAQLGWKPRVSSDIFWTDALVTLGHFNLSGSIFNFLAGSRFNYWARQNEQKVQDSMHQFKLGDIFGKRKIPQLKLLSETISETGSTGEGLPPLKNSAAEPTLIFNTRLPTKPIYPTGSRKYLVRKEHLDPATLKVYCEVYDRVLKLKEKLKIEIEKYEKSMMGILSLLERLDGSKKGERNQRNFQKKKEKLYEKFLRLSIKHTVFNRKYKIALDFEKSTEANQLNALDYQRGKDIAASLQKALVRSRKYLTDIKLPNFPKVHVLKGGLPDTLQTAIDQFQLKCADKKLDLNFSESILSMVSRSGNKDEMLKRDALKGLVLFLEQSGRDEIQGMVSFVKRVTQSNPQDVSSFEVFLYRIMLPFSHRSISREDVLHILGRTNNFHETWPLAFGSFIDLFASANITPKDGELSPRATLFAEPILDFAREKLDLNNRGNRVTFARESIGYAMMMVEEPAGERSIYAVGPFLGELKNEAKFQEIGEKLFEKLFLVAPEMFKFEGEDMPKLRIHMTVTELGKSVGADKLWVWGKYLLENGKANALGRLVGDTFRIGITKEDSVVQTPKEIERFQEASRDHWYERDFPEIESVEIDYKLSGENKNRRHTIDRNLIFHEERISSLQTELKDEKLPAKIRAEKFLELARIFEGDHRTEEFKATLREGVRIFPQNKSIRNFYQEWVRGEITKAFPIPKESRSITDPITLRLFETLFGKKLDEPLILDLLKLHHPRYRFEDISIYREGNRLRLDFVFREKSKEIGKVLAALEIPEHSSLWDFNIINFEIKPKHQKKSIATFAMSRFIELAKELKINRLILEGDDIGRYAWLRMGFKFVKPEDEAALAGALQLFIQKNNLRLHFSPRHLSYETVNSVINLVNHMSEQDQNLLLRFLETNPVDESSLASSVRSFIENRKILLQVSPEMNFLTWSRKESLDLLVQLSEEDRQKFLEYWHLNPIYQLPLAQGSAELAEFKRYHVAKYRSFYGLRSRD